jgi:sensor histidine kinase regulating citrate/malate metabolism
MPEAKRKFRHSIKFKLGLLITSLVVSTVLVISVYLLRQEQTSLAKEMTKRGLTIARDMAASAKNPLLTDDQLTLNLLVKDAMRDEDVAYVIFTDDKDTIVAHNDVALVGKRLERPQKLNRAGDQLLIQTYKDLELGSLLDFSVPLEFSKVRLGTLYLGFSQKSIDETLARARNQTLWITLFMIVVGIGGAIGLSLVMMRPISRLLAGTKAIAAGNFQIALTPSFRDEIGELVDAFNAMAKSLREKEMLKRAFTRYVAREVVEEIITPTTLWLWKEKSESKRA